jgi:hypothetical protein
MFVERHGAVRLAERLLEILVSLTSMIATDHED